MNPVKQGIIILLCGLVAVGLQSSVLPALLAGSLMPNLVVLIAVFVGFYFPSGFGAFISFLLGLELDAASGNIIGPWAGGAVVAFGALAALAQRIFVESALAVFVSVLLMAVVADVVYLILSGTPPESLGTFFVKTCGGGIVSGALGLLIFPILRRIVLGQGAGRYGRRGRR